MKIFKKAATYLTAIILGISMVSSVIAFSASAEDAFSQWNTDGWVKGTEDNTPVLKSTPGASINVLYLNGKAAGNKLSFDLRLDKSFGTVDGNIGAAYKMTNGAQYFFEYNTVNNLIRIRRLGSDGSDNHVFPGKSFTLSVGSFHSIDIEFSSNRLVWMIDNTVVAEVKNTGNDSFENGTLYLQSYYADITIRNIVVESVEVPIVEKQDYDFAFKSAESIKNFKTHNSSIKWSNDRLIWTLSGNDSSLTSPAISAEPGTQYSAMLPLRNTILIRMSNSTDCSKMKLSYTTTADPFFSEDKSIILDVIPKSKDTTYYFNLSRCANLGGYLYGFKLEPVNASSGTIEIEEISFEREAAIVENPGNLLSCTTDGNTITITGTLKSEYSGCDVVLYDTKPENYTLKLNSSDVIATSKSEGTNFKISIPYMNKDGLTRLSSLFLLGVKKDDGETVRLGERFWIENADDFSGGNPYKFNLPGYTVSVIDFGAVGDGYTNDNAAIQSAIDHVYSKGGGVVVVPGDDSFYGKRYVATHIVLKDNIELRIESGAVIWQSPRVEDYDYDVAIGHDVSIPGVNWTHAGSCHNYPLIHGDKSKNIRVTGGGIIRMQDTGSENYDSVSGSIWTGCENRIHLVPLGFYLCENVEVNNVHLRRTNNYHINFRNSRNIYCSGISMWEVTCASGDGISATVGTKNIVINQCFLYTNDDAVTICSTYNDPRGLAWWHANPDGDNCVDNLVVRHSYLVGGHGITFITWGTDNPDLEKQEIKNVEVFDCVLGGGTQAVGSWADNPYFGKTPYDGSEINDYSPVKSIRIHDNRYIGKATLDSIQATDVITDCGIRSAIQFQYGNFERGLRNRPNFVTGLSNWNFHIPDGKSGKAQVETENNNHYGVVYGEGTLCQGLWMNKGEHTYTADIRLLSGSAKLTVTNAITGNVIAEKDIAASEEFKTVTLVFKLEEGCTAYLGVTHTGSEKQCVQIDNASVTSEIFQKTTYFTEEFSDPETLQVTNDGFTITDGIALSGPNMTGILKLIAEKTYKDFDLHYKMRYDSCNSEVDANIGVSLRRVDGNNQYDIHYNPIQKTLYVNEYINGQLKNLFKKGNVEFEEGKWIDVAFRIQNNTCIWYMDGEEVTSFSVKNISDGVIALVAYNVSCAYDDVVIAKAGTTIITGNEEIQTETESESESLTETESESESLTETESESESLTETNSESESESTSETESTSDKTTETSENITIEDETSDKVTEQPNSGCKSTLSTGFAGLISLFVATICPYILWHRHRKKLTE